MSIVHEWARSVARRSPSRLLQKTRLNIETLEGRALLSGLAFVVAREPARRPDRQVRQREDASDDQAGGGFER
jgi:hypothetical protein